MSKSTLLAIGLSSCFALLSPAARAEANGGGLPGFERDGPVVFATSSDSDDCLFFRGQAHEPGLRAFANDMLLACEEIARRRAAGMRLSDRLEATDQTLQSYRRAVIAAGTEAIKRKHPEPEAPWTLGLSSAEKYAIADATGVLLVLEAIRGGF